MRQRGMCQPHGMRKWNSAGRERNEQGPDKQGRTCDGLVAQQLHGEGAARAVDVLHRRHRRGPADRQRQAHVALPRELGARAQGEHELHLAARGAQHGVGEAGRRARGAGAAAHRRRLRERDVAGHAGVAINHHGGLDVAAAVAHTDGLKRDGGALRLLRQLAPAAPLRAAAGTGTGARGEHDAEPRRLQQ